MRTEKVQYAMLQLQNLANIWRRTAVRIAVKFGLGLMSVHRLPERQ